MSAELENLLANKFIARTDVKAIQKPNLYMPVTHNGKPDGEREPWTREDLRDHLAGHRTFGHYMVNNDDECKLFAYDIDLTKTGQWVGIEEDGSWTDMEPKECEPRRAWLHSECPPHLRRYLTAQLREVAEHLARSVVDILDLPVAIQYSGGKGLHVYAFTGPVSAADAKGAALEVLASAGRYEAWRGEVFWREAVTPDLKLGNNAVEIEVFPKQGSLDGKDLGNLMRLPLGIHRRTGQRAYFVDCASEVTALPEADPTDAMTEGNPWQSR